MIEVRFNNRRSKNELSIVNFKAIGLLEVQNSNNIISILVSQLQQHEDQGKNGDGEKYHYTKIS